MANGELQNSIEDFVGRLRQMRVEKESSMALDEAFLWAASIQKAYKAEHGEA